MRSSPQIIGQTPDQASPPAGTGQAGTEPAEPVAPDPTPVRLDPTRYGDWERNGRCIDF